MFRILETNELGRGVKLFVIEAARVARKQKPGQFVIVRLHEHGERIPLTIADFGPHEGTITLVVQGIGKTTCLLNMLEGGDSILDIAGHWENPPTCGTTARPS
jgi:ferredoxin--NADP+ reductase